MQKVASRARLGRAQPQPLGLRLAGPRGDGEPQTRLGRPKMWLWVQETLVPVLLLVPSPTQGAMPWLWEKRGSLSLTRGPLIWAGLSPALGLGLTI